MGQKATSTEMRTLIEHDGFVALYFTRGAELGAFERDLNVTNINVTWNEIDIDSVKNAVKEAIANTVKREKDSRIERAGKHHQRLSELFADPKTVRIPFTSELWFRANYG